MERLKNTNPDKLLKTVLLGLGGYLLYELALSIPNGTKEQKKQFRDETPRDLIKERAGEKCEKCGLDGKGTYLVVSHLYHDEPGYNDPENLRLYCIACETLHHLLHVNQVDKIGLEKEEDNLNSTHGLLVAFYQHSPKKFRHFYELHRPKIKIVFRYFKTNYSQFLEEKSAHAAAIKDNRRLGRQASQSAAI